MKRLEELKNWNKEKVSFIKDDINKLLDYHANAGLFVNSRTYAESCQLDILNTLLKLSEDCKTFDDLKYKITVLINSSNPL